MQVNSINTQSFRAGYEQKILRGHLKDDSTAVVRVTFDKVTQEIRHLEAYEFKKGRLIHGIGDGNSSGLSDESIAVFFDKLEASAKEGVDFFRELTVALLRG